MTPPAVADGQQSALPAASSDTSTFTTATIQASSANAIEFFNSLLEKAITAVVFDAVIIATPHSLHLEQIGIATNAGKHVFVEKPLAITAHDAGEAFALAEAARVLLAVGHNRRFLEARAWLKELIASGALGTLMHVEGTVAGPGALNFQPGSWRSTRAESPLGGFTGMGLHVLDSMVDICGHVSSLSAQSARKVLAIDIDDTSSMLMRFASGTTGYLGCIAVSAPHYSVRLFGSHGSAELMVRSWDVLRGAATLFHTDLKGLVETRQGACRDIELAELEAFADAIIGVAPYPVSACDVVA